MVEERIERRLAAILAADVVGFSRLMAEDEAGTLAALKAHRAELLDPLVAGHNGRIVKLMGDGALIEFASVVDAVQCAVDLQSGISKRNAEVPEDRRIEFRVGVNLGDVILDGDDIYGDGVNVAARLEGLADPGGICVSGTVRDALGNKLAVGFIDLGEQAVKNIATPLRTYRVTESTDSGGAGVFCPATRPRPGSKGSQVPSLAVAPFETSGSDPDQEDFAFGLTNGIVVALTKVPGLCLVGDESPSLEASQGLTAEELGRRFNVDYVLKGSVRKYGARVRVNAEFIEVSSGRYLWGEQFDRDLHDLGDFFTIQDEITEEIVTALDVKLFGGEAVRLVRRTFTSPAALETYYRGENTLWRSTSRLELHDAQRLLEETIRLEPKSSVGYAVAGLAYWMEALSNPGDAASACIERATKRVQEAIALDDVTGYPHLVLAHIHLTRREYAEASLEADRAVSSRPSCPASYSLKAAVLNYLGRPAEALDFALYAERLTPVRPPMYPAIVAQSLYGSERYEDAIAAASSTIELDARGVDPYVFLAASNAALDCGEEAQRVARNLLRLKPDFSLAAFAQSQPYKERDYLDRLVDRLRSAGLE